MTLVSTGEITVSDSGKQVKELYIILASAGERLDLFVQIFVVILIPKVHMPKKI